MKTIQSFIPAYGNEIRYDDNSILGVNFYKNGEEKIIKRFFNNDVSIVIKEIEKIKKQNQKNKKILEKAEGHTLFGGRWFSFGKMELA